MEWDNEGETNGSEDAQTQEVGMRRIVALMVVLVLAGIVGLGEGPPVADFENTIIATELSPASIGVVTVPLDVQLEVESYDYMWRDHAQNIMTMNETTSAGVDTTTLDRVSTVDERHNGPTFYELGYHVRS